MVSASALLTIALSALATAAPLLPRVNCVSGLYIIVARGSNEAAGEGKPGQVATLIKQRVPNSVSVAVNYPATLTSYPDSVTAGIQDTISKIQDYVNTCGSGSRIALLGYSQGGNVMTDVLAGGVDKPAPLSDKYRRNSKSQIIFRSSETLSPESDRSDTFMQSVVSLSSVTQVSPLVNRSIAVPQRRAVSSPAIPTAPASPF
jgi:hypothetical protein